MLKRLFGQKTRQSEAVALVRAEPEFVVEGRTVIAKACTIHWNEGTNARQIRLRRDLRPAQPVVVRDGAQFGVDLIAEGAAPNALARALDYRTAVQLHRVYWNWIGQLCQNGHDAFPINLTLPENGFDHDRWPEAGR